MLLITKVWKIHKLAGKRKSNVKIDDLWLCMHNYVYIWLHMFSRDLFNKLLLIQGVKLDNWDS